MDSLGDHELCILGNGGVPECSTAGAHERAAAWSGDVHDKLRASASGPVVLEAPEARVVAWRLQAVATGGDAKTVLLIQPRPPWLSAERLTPRQRQICDFAASGATVDEIARHLTISEHTVRTHLKMSYRLLQVANRVELARALSMIT